MWKIRNASNHHLVDCERLGLMVWFGWWAVFSRMEEKPSQWLVYDTSGTYLKGSEIWLKRKNNCQNMSSDPLADKCLNKPLIFHHGPLHPWWREFQSQPQGLIRYIISAYPCSFFVQRTDLPTIDMTSPPSHIHPRDSHHIKGFDQLLEIYLLLEGLPEAKSTLR